MQQKHKFQQTGVVDADILPSQKYSRAQALASHSQHTSLFMIGAVASLLVLIATIALMISNWLLYIQSMSILLQVLVWAIAIGLPGVAIFYCVKQVTRGVMWGWSEIESRLDQRAERRRLDAINRADVARVEAEAAEIQARAFIAMRTVAFDQNGNAAVIGVPSTQITQITGQVVQPAARSITNNNHGVLPEHAASKETSAPTFEEALRNVEPNAYQIYLGKSITEKDTNIIAELPDNHLLLIGATRMGKSCTACMIVDQMTRTHDTDHLQIALLDLEDQNCNLFTDLPHVLSYEVGGRQVQSIARSAQEVAKHMNYLVRLMDERYTLTPKDRAKLPRILIYIEEFVELKRRLKGQDRADMADNFTSLATRGLKANMHLMVAAQASYAEEEFREAMGQLVGIDLSFCARPKLAQAAGFMDYALLNRNYLSRTKGQFVIEATGQSDIAVAVGYDVKVKLLAKQEEEEAKLGAHVQVREVQNRPHLYPIEGGAHPSRTLPAPEGAAPSAPAWEAYVDVIEQLQHEGHVQDEIIEKIWHIKKGGNQKYYDARDMYRNCNQVIKQRKQEQFERGAM